MQNLNEAYTVSLDCNSWLKVMATPMFNNNLSSLPVYEDAQVQEMSRRIADLSWAQERVLWIAQRNEQSDHRLFSRLSTDLIQYVSFLAGLRGAWALSRVW